MDCDPKIAVDWDGLNSNFCFLCFLNIIVPVIQNGSIRKETNFYDENNCLVRELMKQVELFQNVKDFRDIV